MKCNSFFRPHPFTHPCTHLDILVHCFQSIFVYTPLFVPILMPLIGDSRYTTYLVNPTTIDKGLTVAGATRIGAMGKADAKQIGENSQENVIAKWKEEMWIPLAKSIAAVTVDENKNSEEAKTDIMKEMQAATIPILMKIDPDYTPPKEFGGRSAGAIPTNLLLVAIIMAVIATLFVTGKIQVP